MFETIHGSAPRGLAGNGRSLAIAALLHVVAFGLWSTTSAVAIEPVEPPPVLVRVFLSSSLPLPLEETPLATRSRAEKLPQTARKGPADPPVVQPKTVNETETETATSTVGTQTDLEPIVIGEDITGGGSGTGTGANEEATGNTGPAFAVEAKPDEPIRMGGNVIPPGLLYQSSPEYPPVARATRTSGIVIIEAVISAEGVVESARVLRGHPLLDEAALAAALKFRFTPARLHGRAVPVYFTLTVNFQLR